MANHLGRARLTSASSPRGPGKTPLGDETLPVGCDTETIIHRQRRLCSVPQEVPFTNSFFASLKKESVYTVYSHLQRTHITVMRRWHSLSSLIPRRHSQTHSQWRCLGHTSFFMHGDKRVYSPLSLGNLENTLPVHLFFAKVMQSEEQDHRSTVETFINYISPWKCFIHNI